MTQQRRSVSTAELTVGMFIAELDRPWLETPFLFQGFYLESEHDIKEVRRFCQHVYVDVDRSIDTDADDKVTPKSIHACRDKSSIFSASKAGQPEEAKAKRWKGRIAGWTRKGNKSFRALRNDIERAKSAHAETLKAINGIFAALRQGKDLDVRAADQAVEPMVDIIVRNEDALSWLARMKQKDNYVHDHSIASSVWAMIFGRHLGLDKEDIHVLGLGALLMDVGKTQIPTDLLVKTAELAPDELSLLKKHVEFGREIARNVEGVDKRVIEMIESHHERHNGTGYSQNLKGSQIPVFARMAGIVDAFDAMTTSRPYADPMSTYDAMRQLNDLAGVEFQAEMVEQFVQALGIFPVGTLVALSTGEVAVVIGQNRTRRLRPQVMLLTDEEKNILATFKTIDLRCTLTNASGESLFISSGLPPGAYGLDPSEYYL